MLKSTISFVIIIIIITTINCDKEQFCKNEEPNDWRVSFNSSHYTIDITWIDGNRTVNKTFVINKDLKHYYVLMPEHIYGMHIKLK